MLTKTVKCHLVIIASAAPFSWWNINLFVISNKISFYSFQRFNSLFELTFFFNRFEIIKKLGIFDCASFVQQSCRKCTYKSYILQDLFRIILSCCIEMNIRKLFYMWLLSFALIFDFVRIYKGTRTGLFRVWIKSRKEEVIKILNFVSSSSSARVLSNLIYF